MNRSTVVRWTLFHDHRQLTCLEVAAPSGIEIGITYNGLRLATRLCHTLEEAARWAEQIRSSWEERGWAAA